MAEKKLAELEAEARRRWPLIDCSIVHRLGHLELGEASIAIAVSSPHRHDAFAAGQWLIDTHQTRRANLEAGKLGGWNERVGTSRIGQASTNDKAPMTRKWIGHWSLDIGQLNLMNTEPLIDALGRVHTNLRISVTDRCNIRCFYCMPDENVRFLPRREILTFEEIERFVRVVAQLGREQAAADRRRATRPVANCRGWSSGWRTFLAFATSH